MLDRTAQRAQTLGPTECGRGQLIPQVNDFVRMTVISLATYAAASTARTNRPPRNMTFGSAGRGKSSGTSAGGTTSVFWSLGAMFNTLSRSACLLYVVDDVGGYLTRVTPLATHASIAGVR
jgi:hypothetical protein